MAASNHYGTLPLGLPPAKGSLIETYRPLVRVARHPRDLLSYESVSSFFLPFLPPWRSYLALEENREQESRIAGRILSRGTLTRSLTP